jgi:hypothetical protein
MVFLKSSLKLSIDLIEQLTGTKVERKHSSWIKMPTEHLFELFTAIFLNERVTLWSINETECLKVARRGKLPSLAWGTKGVESGDRNELKLRPSRSKGTEMTPFFVKNLKTKLIKSKQREITPLSFLYIFFFF